VFTFADQETSPPANIADGTQPPEFNLEETFSFAPTTTGKEQTPSASVQPNPAVQMKFYSNPDTFDLQPWKQTFIQLLSPRLLPS